MKLEKKLTCLRQKKGLSQMELAETLDVSRQAVSKWEMGETRPTTENLKRLSQLYGVPMDALLDDGRSLEDWWAEQRKDPAERNGKPFHKKRWAAAIAVIAAVRVVGILIGMLIGSIFGTGRGDPGEFQIEDLPIEKIVPEDEEEFPMYWRED